MVQVCSTLIQLPGIVCTFIAEHKSLCHRPFTSGYLDASERAMSSTVKGEMTNCVVSQLLQCSCRPVERWQSSYLFPSPVDLINRDRFFKLNWLLKYGQTIPRLDFAMLVKYYFFKPIRVVNLRYLPFFGQMYSIRCLGNRQWCYKHKKWLLPSPVMCTFKWVKGQKQCYLVCSSTVPSVSLNCRHQATRCNEPVTIDSRKQMSLIGKTYSHWAAVGGDGMRPYQVSWKSSSKSSSMSNHGIWRSSHLFASEEKQASLIFNRDYRQF